MLTKEMYPNMRRRQRLNGEFEISLPHQVKGGTKDYNIFKSLWQKTYMLIEAVVLLAACALAMLFMVGRKYYP